MTLETFFEKFDQVADAPDAVAKMRGLILRLAMQGKLSDPHKADCPVSELLREVEKDKTRLGLESSATGISGNSDFSGDETADVIPARWTWVHFGNIARHNAGKTLDRGRNRGELRDYITTSNLYWGFFQLDAVRQMPMLDDELERCTAIKGDLLICEGGEAGRAAVWPYDREISFQNHVHRARFFAGINPYFVQRYLEKLNATGEIEKYRKGVGISNMSGKALASVLVPLPPLAEQKRIVAKVDELMTLCDRLEAQQQERETRHAALARASLARFADTPTPANLNFLFHPSYAIPPADLRKSILTLAVQGKLVPQDPNDKPAETDSECEAPFDIPSNWQWKPLGGLGLCRTGKTPPTGDPANYGLGFPFIGPGQIKLSGRFIASEKSITPQGLENSTEAKAGDILMVCIGGSIGKAAICREPIGFNQQINAVRLQKDLPEFVYLAVTADYFQEQVLANASGSATPIINKGKWEQIPIPLPPLAEQRRIVAKVEQLMALVDALETQLAASRKKGQKLLEAVVGELTLAS